MRRKSAFTLIELLIALAIFSIVALVLYAGLQSGISGYKKYLTASQGSGEVRQLFNQFNLDLHNSVRYSLPKSGFTGDKERITFFTVRAPYKQAVVREEVFQVSYYIENEAMIKSLLSLKDQLAEDSLVQPQRIELIPKIKSLEFSYASINGDGIFEWKEGWDDPQSKVPSMIKMNIRDANNDLYSKIVLIPFADKRQQ